MPIYNDIYVMFFFGLLKKYTGRWVVTGDSDDKVKKLFSNLLTLSYRIKTHGIKAKKAGMPHREYKKENVIFMHT